MSNPFEEILGKTALKKAWKEADDVIQTTRTLGSIYGDARVPKKLRDKEVDVLEIHIFDPKSRKAITKFLDADKINAIVSKQPEDLPGLAEIEVESYAEQFADEEDIENIVRIRIGDEDFNDPDVAKSDGNYRYDVKQLRALSKWAEQAADWLANQSYWPERE